MPAADRNDRSVLSVTQRVLEVIWKTAVLLAEALSWAVATCAAAHEPPPEIGLDQSPAA